MHSFPSFADFLYSWWNAVSFFLLLFWKAVNKSVMPLKQCCSGLNNKWQINWCHQDGDRKRKQQSENQLGLLLKQGCKWMFYFIWMPVNAICIIYPNESLKESKPEHRCMCTRKEKSFPSLPLSLSSFLLLFCFSFFLLPVFPSLFSFFSGFVCSLSVPSDYEVIKAYVWKLLSVRVRTHVWYACVLYLDI